MMEMPDGSILLPTPPRNARKVAKGRREHFTGQLTAGPDEGTGMDIESFTEFQVALALLARPSVVSLENQVPFEYCLGDEVHWHFFDFRATLRDGSRTVIMVKSAYRHSQPEVRDELAYIASQVTADFADRVVVLTEKNLDAAEIYNAEMMHEMRRPEPLVDAAARRAIQGLIGSVRISDLVEHIGQAGQGFRAIVRLIRSGELKINRRVRLSYDSMVIRSSTDA